MAPHLSSSQIPRNFINGRPATGGGEEDNMLSFYTRAFLHYSYSTLSLLYYSSSILLVLSTTLL